MQLDLQQTSLSSRLHAEEGVEVGLAVLVQHLVHSHHHARVEEVEGRVGLQVRQHASQADEVGRDDAGQGSEVESGGGEGNQSVSDPEQLSVLAEVAHSVAHIDAAGLALAVAGYGHFGGVAAVGSAEHAGGEGAVGAGDAVGMALL